MVGNPGGLFTLTPAGRLSTAVALSNAANPLVTLMVNVSNNGTPPLSAVYSMSVVVLYSPLPPGVYNTSMTVSANALPGSVVGTISNTDTSGTLTFVLVPALSDAGVSTLFKVQACAGNVLVNQVRARWESVCLDVYVYVSVHLVCVYV